MVTASIVAMSSRCAVGLRPEAAAAAVRAGISRVGEHPFLVDPDGDLISAALDPTLPERALATERMASLVDQGLRQLLERLTIRFDQTGPVPVLLALPQHRPGYGASDDERVLSVVAREKGRFVPYIAARGHAGGLHALKQCQEMLASGSHRIVVVGGVESYFHGDTIEWLLSSRRIQCQSTRSGFFPGEAVGFMALSDERSLRSLGLQALSTLRGVESADELASRQGDEVNQARALTQAIRGACRTLSPGEVCERIICDINGERYRTDEWSTTLLRVSALLLHGPGRPAMYESPASSWGDVGAASGPLFCTLAVAGWQRQYAPGDRALLFAGSDGGLRTAVVLQKVGG